MTKVLHVFGQMHFGGAEKRTLDVVRHADRQAIAFDFCTVSGLPGELDAELKSLGCRVLPCRLDAGFLGRFNAMLEQGRYDVVHAHLQDFSGVILLLAALKRVPVRIAHYRTTTDGKGRTPRRVAERVLMRALVNQFATHILAVSEGTMREAWSPDWQADGRCRVVYNGLDTATFADNGTRPSVREELGIPAGAPVVLHIGRFDPAKNHEKVLGVAADLIRRDSRVRVLLVGKGDERIGGWIEETIGNRGLAENVQMLGARDDVPRLLHASDLLLLPSRSEGLPGVVLEAIAAGTPVVASDLSGVLEIAGHYPSVVPVSLERTNDEWARIVIERMSLGKATRSADAVAVFQHGPFGIERCVAALSDIWRTGHTNRRHTGGVRSFSARP